MIKKNQILVFVSISVVAVLSLCACGGTNKTRIYEKHRSPSDIKISKLDIESKTMEFRFEYRSYMQRNLESIICDINFNTDSSLTINQQQNLSLDTFSTEIIKFDQIEINNLDDLYGSKNIDYTLNCTLNFDKGSERVYEESVMHLVPGYGFQYR